MVHRTFGTTLLSSSAVAESTSFDNNFGNQPEDVKSDPYSGMLNVIGEMRLDDSLSSAPIPHQSINDSNTSQTRPGAFTFRRSTPVVPSTITVPDASRDQEMRAGAAKMIGSLLMNGHTMLDGNCPTCNCVLMAKGSGPRICAGCTWYVLNPLNPPLNEISSVGEIAMQVKVEDVVNEDPKPVDPEVDEEQYEEERDSTSLDTAVENSHENSDFDYPSDSEVDESAKFRDEVSKRMGSLLLKRYTMLGEMCATCGGVLLQLGDAPKLCIECQLRSGEKDDALYTTPIEAPAESFKSPTEAPVESFKSTSKTVHFQADRPEDVDAVGVASAAIASKMKWLASRLDESQDLQEISSLLSVMETALRASRAFQ